MKNFKFREATSEDIEQLVDLAYELNLYHEENFKPLKNDILKNWSAFEAYVIENDENVIVAFLTGYDSYQLHAGTLRFEIQNLHVSGSFRHKGVGRKLVTNVVNKKWRDGIRKFSLGVKVNNEAARSFYSALGFKTRPQDHLRCILEGESLNRLIDLTTSKLEGLKILVTAGPTIEPIDPVRFLSNHSSGRQGVAIAKALHDAGANVTLVAGPLKVNVPYGINHIAVQTAEQMLQACMNALPVDVAICTAAVADYRVKNVAQQKIKKDGTAPVLQLEENPDILATIAQHKNRPRLVIGFAAETENLTENARVKLKKKKCDVIIANSVADGAVFDSLSNRVEWISLDIEESWPLMSKDDVAQNIAKKLTHIFEEQ